MGRPWGGAGIIVVLLARGVSASKADWSEQMREGGSTDCHHRWPCLSRRQLAADVSSWGEKQNA